MTLTRILVLKGYTNPFGDSPKPKKRGKTMKRRSSKRKMSYGMTRQASKMQSCAREYKAEGKPGKYTSFMKKCLKK